MLSRSAVITGSTSGIGLGIAREFAANGINIMLNGFGDRAEIEQIQQELSKYGVKVLYSGADMTKPDEIRQMIEFASNELGGVDILVNNAGIQYVHELKTYPEEKWDAIIAVDLSAAFHTTKAVLSHMEQQKWGRIINISSAHGLVASPHKCAYVAAKHGIIGLTKVTALEGGIHGITCNSICPGFVWTALVEKQIDDLAATRGISKEQVIDQVMLKEHATKEFTTIEQLAKVATFLVSDAAANITGISMPIDGGWTAH